MSEVWVVIGGLAVANLAIKATGPLIAGSGGLPDRLERHISLVIPALMGALVATGTLADGRQLVLDPRAAGVAAAALAAAARLPMLAIMLAAALTTALVRALA